MARWTTRRWRKKVAALGYYRYLVPAAYGGALPTVDVRSLCVLREEMGARNAAADSLFAVQGLGSHPVLLAGSEAQKLDLLSKVVAGTALFAFALTEPEAGSDVASLTTRAGKRRRLVPDQRRETFHLERRRGDALHGVRAHR